MMEGRENLLRPPTGSQYTDSPGNKRTSELDHVVVLLV